MSAHLDFKRGRHGWLVWCQREWWAVGESGRTRFCRHCGADISGRFA